MRRKRNGFLVFHDILDLLEEMPAENVKHVMLAVGRFSERVSNGETPQEETFKGLEKVAYTQMRDGVMYSNAKYLKTAAYNRARRLGIEKPQLMTYHELHKRGFSVFDIAIFKDTDEEEVKAILEKAADEVGGVQQNKAVADLTDLFLPMMRDTTRGELSDFIGSCVLDGKEKKLRQALMAMGSAKQSMTMQDLRAYLARGV